MSLGCENYRDELSPYFDGELDLPGQKVIGEHLQQCQACHTAYAEMEALSLLYAKSREEIAVPDMWAAISSRLISDCEVVREDLSAYLDGELNDFAKEGLEAHTGTCPDCAQKLSDLKATDSLLSQGLALPEAVEVDLWAAVKSRLNEDCALIQSELSAFLDQEVAGLRHRSIVEHLLDCLSCRKVYAGLKGTGDLIRSSYTPEIPENFDLWPEIQAKLKVVPFVAKSEPKPAKPKFKLVALSACVLVAFVFGSLIVANHTVPQVRPMTAEGYLLEQALVQPAANAELVLYEDNQ